MEYVKQKHLCPRQRLGKSFASTLGAKVTHARLRCFRYSVIGHENASTLQTRAVGQRVCSCQTQTESDTWHEQMLLAYHGAAARHAGLAQRGTIK
eukprot:6482063-Amphidinium_carterae.2